MQKIPPNDSKLTYAGPSPLLGPPSPSLNEVSLAADQILIHYQKKDGVTALVVAEDTAGRRMPFSFLAELHRKVCTFPRSPL